MMIPESYATVAEYRAAIHKIDEGADDVIERDLLAVSRYLERRTGRIFARDVEPERRRFYFGWSCWVPTDDMSEEPEIVALGLPPGGPLDAVNVAESGRDFRPYPSTALQGLHAIEPRAYEGLHFTAPRSVGYPVDIVLRWGWPAVPVGIERATIEITAIWRLESPRATSRVNELDQVVGTSELANRIVKDLIDTYRRSTFVVA